MKTNVNKHLDEDQLLRAITEQEDLSIGARDHLKDCRYCKGQIGDLQETLEMFGNKIQANVPASLRKVHLPAESPESEEKRFHSWSPAYGALALTAIALLIFLWPRPGQKYEVEQFSSQVDLVEDEILMQEISELVEDAMPEGIYVITSDMQDGFDDFLQFVIPDYIDDTQSYNLNNGGIRKC
jgi:hypothetical protein